MTLQTTQHKQTLATYWTKRKIRKHDGGNSGKMPPWFKKLIVLIIVCSGLHGGGVVVSTVTTQQDDSKFKSLYVWRLHVLLVYACVLAGYSGFCGESRA